MWGKPIYYQWALTFPPSRRQKSAEKWGGKFSTVFENGEFELIQFNFSGKDSKKKTICIEKEVGSKYQSKINKLELVIHGANAFEGKVKVGKKTYTTDQIRKGDLLIIPIVFSKSNIKIEWIP
jgi:hypothetical protein